MRTMAAANIKGGGVCVTVKVMGNNLVFSIAKDVLERGFHSCFTIFLMSSYSAAFSRWQVRFTTDKVGVET